MSVTRRKKGLSFYKKDNRIHRAVWKTVASYLFWTLVMVLIAFVFTFCFGIKTSVIGVSMEPTLYNGEEICINRFQYFLSSPGRGDVIVFLPNGNANSHYYVKRVIGIPGDTVEIKDGLIYINDEIYEEKGNYDRIIDGGIASIGVTLGEDEYFVLGDNRNNSEDSRSSNVGVVKKEYIVGRAWFHLKTENGPAGLIK